MDLADFYADVASLSNWAGHMVRDANSRNGYGCTPLHVAAIRGDIEAIRALLGAGAHVDARGEHGFTPLHEALTQSKIEAVRVLLASGASVTIKNEFGNDALAEALASGAPAAVELVRNAAA